MGAITIGGSAWEGERLAGIDEAQAFARQLELQLDRAYRLAGLILGNASEAEDVVGDALERAWARRAQLRDPDRLQAWLDRIVVNACRDRIRRRGRVRMLQLDAAADPMGDPDPFAAVIARDELSAPARCAAGRRACGRRPALLGRPDARVGGRPTWVAHGHGQVTPPSGAWTAARVDVSRRCGGTGMTDDLERHLRDRFQHAALPPAPDRLRERLATTAAEPAEPVRRPLFGRRPPSGGRWLLLPVAALLAAALAVGLLVVGGQPSQTVVTARSGDFVLTLTSAKSVYAYAENIDVSGSIEYTGPNASVDVYASTDRACDQLLMGCPVGVTFALDQLDGPLKLHPGSLLLPSVCLPWNLEKGNPRNNALETSSLFNPGQPLSPGTWRVTAYASFGTQSCADPIDLSASLVITVSKYAISPSPTSPETVFLPTYRPMNGYPAALIQGTLVEDNNCLYIDSNGERNLVLWPPGTSTALDGGQLVVRGAGQQVAVGTAVEAGGGQYKSYNYVTGLIGESVPAACRGSDIYWLAVEPAPASPTPKFVTPGPTPWPSNACGGFHLKVVNGDADPITVTINDTYSETVEGGGSQTLVEWLPPNKPLMPWTVVVTGPAGTQIGSAYMTGPVDQKIIVSGGQMEYGPYDIRTEGCG